MIRHLGIVMCAIALAGCAQNFVPEDRMAAARPRAVSATTSARHPAKKPRQQLRTHATAIPVPVSRPGRADDMHPPLPATQADAAPIVLPPPVDPAPVVLDRPPTAKQTPARKPTFLDKMWLWLRTH